MRGGAELMFPDTKNLEAVGAKPSRDAARAFLVQVDLLPPVTRIGLRHRAITTRAAVPEASIHEDGDLEPRKDEIRSAWKLRIVHRPVADAAAYEHCPESPLRGPVALRSHGAHASTAIQLTENVHRNGLARLRTT